MTEITFTITQKELRKKWSEQCTAEEWIEMFENVSNAWSDSEEVVLKIGAYIIQKIRGNFFKHCYHEYNLPDVLKPVIIEVLKDEFLENNLKNQNLNFDSDMDKFELEAIERLRNYEYLSYEDALQFFCEACEFAQENTKDKYKSLSEYSIDELLTEIKNRSYEN